MPQPEFPVDQLRAKEGVFEGSIRWGEAEGPDPVLLFAVTVPLWPLDVDGIRDSKPKLRLHSIRLPVKSWAELEGQTYHFPNVVRRIVADGESHPIYDIYGSLKVEETYHEVVPSVLRWTLTGDCTVEMHLEAEIRATDSPSSFSPAAFSLTAELRVDPVTVVGDTSISAYPSLEEATALCEQLLDMDRYEAPAVAGRCVTVSPRC